MIGTPISIYVYIFPSICLCPLFSVFSSFSDLSRIYSVGPMWLCLYVSVSVHVLVCLLSSLSVLLFDYASLSMSMYLSTNAWSPQTLI